MINMTGDERRVLLCGVSEKKKNCGDLVSEPHFVQDSWDGKYLGRDFVWDCVVETQIEVTVELLSLYAIF